MAEWLVEHGIGEERALLLEDGQVLAAKLHWPGELLAGSVIEAKLVSKPAGASRGLALAQPHHEILVDRLPLSASEGAMIAVELTRSPIAERSRYKPSQGRYCDNPGRIGQHSHFMPDAKEVRRFGDGLWEDVWHTASTGEFEFKDGALHFDITHAMTVIDVDGEGAPQELALRAVPALARVIRQLDLTGSIGIDFPTIPDKAGRRVIDNALSDVFADWPHERTAMNGFGFVQLVARFQHPSLLHRFVNSRAAACARFALRQAENVQEAGAIQLTVNPVVAAKLKPDWLAELARRTGRDIRLAPDPALAPEAGFAQAVPL